MQVGIPKEKYAGAVRPIEIGSGTDSFLVGGETAYPFYGFEGEMPNQPRIAIQVMDCEPEDWAEACLEPYKDVVNDPVAWALKAQNEYGADIIQLWLKSTDPNGMDRSAEEAAETAKKVAEAISVPLIVWGTANIEKDAEVLSKVAEQCAGHDLIIGPIDEGNHKQLGALALAYNLTIVANSPIDVNLAKQLNILLTNLGVPLDRIIIDPTTGSLGYGMEYTYSVMERIRQAAITQDDDKLQAPFLCNLADEVWKTKEAKLPTDEQMGDAAKRGVLMEAITAATLLNAGASILCMRHPDAIYQTRVYISELGGFEAPTAAKTEAAAASATADVTAAASATADSLREGALCEVVQIMDMPINLAPGHAIALIKVVDKAEAGDGLVLGMGGTGPAPEAAMETAKETKAVEEEEEFVPADTWTPVEDITSQYEYALVDKEDAGGKTVGMIEESYDPGQAQGKVNWRDKVNGRQNYIHHLKTDLRYWYSEGFGSEKRKKQA